MSAEIAAAVAALPASGGWVGFYAYDGEEYEASMRALRRAAYARRFVVAGHEGAHGREHLRLVPQAQAPVRCVAGMRHAGKASRRRRRRRAEQRLEAYTYRDRLAKKIGWAAAAKDPIFREMIRARSGRKPK